MSEGPSIERIVHARAVADPSVEALSARADELARSWVLAQLAARPLPAMAEVPLDQLARDAPALCEQLVRALASDSELDRLLASDTASSRGSFSAERVERAIFGTDTSALVVSVEALRSVIWRALLVELRDPPAALIADLADRLGYVSATVLTVVLAALGETRDVALSPGPTPVAAALAPRGEYERSRAAERSGAVLIDELDDQSRPLEAASAAQQERRQAHAEPAAATPDDRAGAVARATAERAVPPRLTASPDARVEAGAGRAERRARAHPWDTPLREERQTPSVADVETISERDVPGDDEAQMRVRRQSSVTVDELR